MGMLAAHVSMKTDLPAEVEEGNVEYKVITTHFCIRPMIFFKFSFKKLTTLNSIN